MAAFIGRRAAACNHRQEESRQATEAGGMRSAPVDSFSVTRIVVLSDGRSAFLDDFLALESAGEIGLLSEPVAADRLILRANPPDYFYDWHNAPRRQFVLMLTGEVEISVATGETRRFSPGQVLFLEDTKGTGHKTISSARTWRLSAFVPVSGPVPFLGSSEGC